jgi:hypothetical protein
MNWETEIPLQWPETPQIVSDKSVLACALQSSFLDVILFGVLQ